MSKITFQCYACSQTLRVDAQKGGRKAKCPGCGTALTIPVASPEPEVLVTPAPAQATAIQAGQAGEPPLVASAVEDVPVVSAAVDGPAVHAAAPDDHGLGERPRRLKKKGKKPGGNWLFTRVGLLVLFIGLCCVCGAVLFDQIGRLLQMIQEISAVNALANNRLPTERPSEAYKTFLKLGGIFFLLAVIPGYVGHVLSLFGPRNGATMGLGIAASIVGGLGWLIYLLFHVLFVFDNAIIKLQSASSLESARFTAIFWYHLVPNVFVGLPFLMGALHVFFIGRLTKSGSAQVCLGAAAAFGLYVLLILISSIVLMTIKLEGINAWKTMTYLQWGMYWLGFLLLFAGLASWTFATFMVRSSARG